MNETEFDKMQAEIKELKAKRKIQWISLVITFLVSVITAYLTGREILNKESQTTLIEKKQEADIQLKMLSFYLDNKDDFLSEESATRKKIFTILMAIDETFENLYTKRFFESLKQIANDEVIETILEVQTLASKPKSFKIRGRIIGENNKSLENIKIILKGDNDINLELVTDNNGYFIKEIKYKNSELKLDVIIFAQQNNEITLIKSFKNNIVTDIIID